MCRYLQLTETDQKMLMFMAHAGNSCRTQGRLPGKHLSEMLHRQMHLEMPNVDTIYSLRDLSEEPMVIPETDRFCKVQVLDAWTNTAAVLDQAGAYAITLSTWEGGGRYPRCRTWHGLSPEPFYQEKRICQMCVPFRKK